MTRHRKHRLSTTVQDAGLTRAYSSPACFMHELDSELTPGDEPDALEERRASPGANLCGDTVEVEI